ncbi:15413_t:CDS:2 [Cetraspora pellucida]|uniref:15413_t:CDS:1 n=1 Tax=Cetraspora pellucida TaxID=1433469 RepID=A0A9N9HKH8_9GLOM|nr:15413_t:CDS:2 [Cetraspora pellucida]
MELDKILSAENGSTLNIPLEDFKDSKKQPSNAIYCQDQNESSKSKTVCKLFGEDYGHLFPRTFTLGGVLSKIYIYQIITLLTSKHND